MKRGESGLSLVIGVNKPSGISSHDVVNTCRRIFGERRVGHMGTLDPLATGVLPIAIGSATRLNPYMSEHDKSYRVTMVFGSETDTDDCEGSITRSAEVPNDLLNGTFALNYIAGLCGERLQVPPQYSAIKVDGKKAYEQARKGKAVQLEPRSIHIEHAILVERYCDAGDGKTRWVVDLDVSKGTYIRALVRDIGRELGCYAHVCALERTRVGALDISCCVNLEELDCVNVHAALDPVWLLGVRFCFCDKLELKVNNGGKLAHSEVELQRLTREPALATCACCTTSFEPSKTPPHDGELIAAIVGNKVKALYSYDASSACFQAACVFATPISRAWY